MQGDRKQATQAVSERWERVAEELDKANSVLDQWDHERELEIETSCRIDS
jgi:hypothetical protein